MEGHLSSGSLDNAFGATVQAEGRRGGRKDGKESKRSDLHGGSDVCMFVMVGALAMYYGGDRSNRGREAEGVKEIS